MNQANVPAKRRYPVSGNRLRSASALLLCAGILTLHWAIGCSSSSSGDGFCSSLCANRATCSATTSGGSGGGTTASAPLFCSTSDTSSSCQSACLESLTSLGSGEDGFVTCAQCALDQLGGGCDASKVDAQSCASDCSNTSSSVSDSFFSDLQTKLATSSSSSCNQVGEKDWNANDPAIKHAGGAASGTGWSCNGNCCETTGHWLYGPYVTLPPGNYEGGVRGLTVTPSAKLGLDVIWDGADNESHYVDIAAGSTSGSTTFTLTAQATGVQVRLFCPQAASVDSVYIKRL